MTQQTVNLPPLDPIAQAHTQKVQAHLRELIQQQGPISFEQYMRAALYAPGLGYYSAGAHKFGEAGDFVTAPEISSLFSRCVARQCQQVLSDLGGGDILEFGPGTGIMALTILRELEQLECLPAHYYLLEVSADLRERQQQLIQTNLPHLADRVVWLQRLPEQPLQGVILVNEVLDAMPVTKFMMQQDGLKACYVDYQEQQFTWQLKAANAEFQQQVVALNIEFSPDYESEINAQLPGWIAAVADSLQQGMVLLIDYGFPRHEYYHAERSMGTLMCHFKHHAHADPLVLAGVQDITAHVDFTAVAEAAVSCGLNVSGYTHQAGFLMGCGIAEMMASVSDPLESMQTAQQIKQLTLPNEMGELFKAIALTKFYDTPLLGFQYMSQLERL